MLRKNHLLKKQRKLNLQRRMPNLERNLQRTRLIQQLMLLRRTPKQLKRRRRRMLSQMRLSPPKTPNQLKTPSLLKSQLLQLRKRRKIDSMFTLYFLKYIVYKNHYHMKL